MAYSQKHERSPDRQRYRYTETSFEQPLIEMYLAGVSIRRVENITKVFIFSNYHLFPIPDFSSGLFFLFLKGSKHFPNI